MTRLLYVFAGVDRYELEKQVKAGEAPDTSFFGFFRVAQEPGFEAQYIYVNLKHIKGFLGSIIRRFSLLRTLYVWVRYRSKLIRQDVLVVTSSAYFGLLFLKRLGFFRRQKFLILNLALSLELRRLETNPLRKRALLAILAAAERIICVSEAQRTDLLKAGMAEAKVRFIPMGVDKKFYKPISSTRELILTVGRDTGRDTKTFLEAIRLVGEPAVMICSPHNLAGLEDQVPSNLSILFNQPYSVLREHYAKAKAFVIATRPASELIGSDCPGQTALLDTLAYGMPTIATEMPWFEGYFRRGEHLIAVTPGEPAVLADAIKRVTTDAARAGTLSREGRALIEKRYNSEALGEAIAELISEVASKG